MIEGKGDKLCDKKAIYESSIDHGKVIVEIIFYVFSQ